MPLRTSRCFKEFKPFKPVHIVGKILRINSIETTHPLFQLTVKCIDMLDMVYSFAGEFNDYAALNKFLRIYYARVKEVDAVQRDFFTNK